jgi:hypothetical protein
MIDDERNILKRIVMDDESWHFMYDPETIRVQLGESIETESSESDAKIAGEDNVDDIF